MADKRKLQGEIDRCLKRVQEGVDTFDDIWHKVQNSANSNQKEKYEADLKKEIKKLQRQRDQIKTWLASSEIKDKRLLLESRKVIETQMERFKVVERETKTKAYSKEGLGAASKLDPAAKEKNSVTNWLSQSIESLKIQTDQLESEVEQLSTTGRKKKLDKERNDRFEQLKGVQEKHQFHIQKLETIMRMVDNDAIPLEQIKTLRDDIEHYVESNQEPDFEENLFLYDELDLDDIPDPLKTTTTSPPHDEDRFSDKLSTTPTSTNSSSPSPSPGFNMSANHSKDDDRKKHKATEESKNNKNSSSSSSNVPPLSSSTSSTISSVKVPNTPTKHNQTLQLTPENSTSNHLPNAVPSSSAWYDGGQSSTSDSKSQSNSINHVSGMPVSSSVLVNSVSTSSNTSLVNSVSTNSIGNPSVSHGTPLNNGLGKDSAPSPVSSQSSAVNSNNNSVITSLTSSLSSVPTSSQAVTNNSVSSTKLELMSGVMNGPSSAGGVLRQDALLSDSMSSLKSIAQQAVMNAGLENQIPSTTDTPSADTKVPFNSSGPQLSPQPSVPSQDGSLQQQQQQQPQTTTIHLNRLLGVAPLGPVPLTKEHIYQLTMGEAAFHHLPHPSDSERLRHYLPRNPCPTPVYYPQLPPPHSDSVEFFQKFSTETLFFIFYYMEGTKAQYLAAKALKRQSWRFHTKYMMWFQRHEEPKTINEDYEQGTYIYFDYEKWAQRKKEGFTFEYRYLEDRDLN